MKKEPGAYWTDDEIKQALADWREKRTGSLRTGEWHVDDIPFYEPGNPSRADLWHRVDYLDEYDLVWDKKWGASGIGKLREVLVSRPTELRYQEKPYSSHIEAFYPRPKGPPTEKDLELWQAEHDRMCQLLKENGVTVHYLEFPEHPIGAYGPLSAMDATSEIAVVWGGAIVPRFGWAPYSKGREKYLAQWLVSHGCPILLTIIGKGVCEAGTIRFLADDCAVVGRGIAYNQDGIEQLRPVFNRVGITTILEVPVPGWAQTCRWPVGGNVHVDMFLCPLDVGKVLLYPPHCGWETVEWLRNHKYEIIEIPAEEQRDYMPADALNLEPGLIIMHAEAKETIRRVKKAGVRVIEAPHQGRTRVGRMGGFYCNVLQLVRDRGPKLEDN